MSQEMRAQEGQAESGKSPSATRTGEWVEPRAVIQESIKYRRRAQEAERRVESLEAEVAALRSDQADRASSLESELAAARTETEAMRGRLATVERDRRLERELAKAGCADTETALALARERLESEAAEGTWKDDPAGFVRGLLDEKPHLRGTSGTKAPAPRPAEVLPPKTAGAKAPGASGPQRAISRLATQARSGDTRDLMTYLRARRGRA